MPDPVPNRRQAIAGLLSVPLLAGRIDENRSVIRPADFGARGDGRTDDTAALRRAVDQALHTRAATIVFDTVTYLVGAGVGHAGSVFRLIGDNGFVMRGRPTFRVRGTNARQVTLFDIQMSDVDVEHIGVVGDTWAVRSVEAATLLGVIACIVRSPSGMPLSLHRFGTIRASNALHAVLYDSNDKSSGRSTDVSVDLIDATNTVYAFNGANSPDNHTIGRIAADNVFRAYFVYGVDGGQADILVGSAYSGIFAGGTCANVAVYTESRPGAYRLRVRDTRNITLNIRNSSDRPCLQISTNSMRPGDTAQGHDNIRATIQSVSGSTLKVSNTSSLTGVQDLTTAYASPKRNIAISADLTKPWCPVDRSAFGLWTNAEQVTIESSNFSACDPQVRSAYLRSGWVLRTR